VSAVGRELLQTLLDELAPVIGALVDSPARSAPAPLPGGPCWTVELVAEGALDGNCIITFDRPGAEALASRAIGVQQDVPASAVADTLREIVGQAVAVVLARPVAVGVTLKVGGVAPRDQAPAAPAASRSISTAPLEHPLAVGVDSALVPHASAPAQQGETREETAGSRINVILDIDLPVVVRFGRTDMPIRSLARLGPGSVIDLGRSPDDPVEVLVSDRVVARGEVVIVGGNYGIRILDVVSPSERMQSMEA